MKLFADPRHVAAGAEILDTQGIHTIRCAAEDVITMGLKQGSFSFMQFAVEGNLPQAFHTFINTRIRENAFREARQTTEEKRMGWVSALDILDADFENANYALGDYLIFSLRVDRKVIAPRLLKLRLLEEQKRHLAETGKTRLGKQMNEAIKDKVRLDLLGRIDPVPTFYDVLWAIGAKRVYFSSLSDKVADDFMDLFKKTFSLGLKRILPQDHPSVSKHKSDNADADDDSGLIGREFLTWLWFKSEERGGRIPLENSREIELHLQKRIALEAGEGEYAQGVVCSGLHTDLPEGKEAIRLGKKVKEAGLKLISDQNEWEFALKADTFYIQSLKMPAPVWQEEPEDPSGALLERIYLIEKAAGVINELFDGFLAVRYSAAWPREEKVRLAQWLKL